MNKTRTPEEILREKLGFIYGGTLNGRLIEEAMQTYAQVVLQWVSENCTYNSELMMWGYKDDLYNYEQLIELFTQQNQK